MIKPKVAFICVHNSCRSQIAQALANYYASDVFESYSAGTEMENHINPDAVRLMKLYYGIDMLKDQYPKLLKDLPKVDIVIKMGCNIVCPFLPAKYEENWGLDDPTGKSDEEFRKIIYEIDKKVRELKEKILSNLITSVSFL